MQVKKGDVMVFQNGAWHPASVRDGFKDIVKNANFKKMVLPRIRKGEVVRFGRVPYPYKEAA